MRRIALVAVAGLATAASAQSGQWDRWDQQGSQPAWSQSEQQWRQVSFLPELRGQDIFLDHPSQPDTYISIEDGSIQAFLDGQRVPSRHIQKRGNALRITDRYGDTAATFYLPRSQHDAQPQRDAFDRPQAQPGRTTDRGWGRQLLEDLFNQQHIDQQRLGSPEMPIADLQTAAIGILMLEASRQDLRDTRHNRGIYIDATHDGMPADQAGLRRGDIVVAIDGRSPATPDRLRSTLRQKNPGDSLRLTVVRNGQERQFNVRTTSIAPKKVNWDYMVTGLEESQLRRDGSDSRASGITGGQRLYGVNVREADDEDLEDALDYYEGLVVSSVTPGSPMERAGLRRGDIIVEIDGSAELNREKFAEHLEQKRAGEACRLTVIRDGRERTLTFRAQD